MVRTIRFLILLLLVSACSAAQQTDQNGPLLIQDVTLGPPTDSPPTRFLSPTPLLRGITPEVLSPLEQVTVEAGFVLVTPTLPPSKTPTETPTTSPTPTLTRTPTVTVTSTATAFLFPTSVIVAVTAPVANPLPQVCDSTWFFIEPRPASCPQNPPLADQGVYQEFERGFMIWVRGPDAIYVLYNDVLQPRWQVYRDQFDEGMVEWDPSYASAPGPNLWQPRRGFGMLWRANAAVRERIGWATQEWEQPYSVSVQTGTDGVIFISDPGSTLFSLIPAGVGWQRYAGA